MDIGQRILFDLFVIFVAAKLGGWAFSWLRQPPVLGELVAGMVIGPHALGFIGRPDAELVAALGSEEAARAALEATYRTMAELGLVFLLFSVGLDMRVEEIFRVGRRQLFVAVLGVVVPFALGYASMRWSGRTEPEALFVGVALVATSVGITARALRDLGVIHSVEARIILGAAVIDDILSLLILGILSGLGGAVPPSSLDIVLLVVEAFAFVVFVALVGTGVVRRYGPPLSRFTTPNFPLVIAVGLCLGLAVLAGRVGLSSIVGAFLAGLVLAEARAHYDIERAAVPVYELLVPFFFVDVGAEVDLGVFARGELLGLMVAITGLAIVGKLVGCGLGALGMGWRPAVIVGVGMVPRGEVGLVVVSLGRALNVIPEDMFAVIVVMSVLTTVIVPPLLARLYADAIFRPPPVAVSEDVAHLGRADAGRSEERRGER
ncbi:MAG: cation:proton antiporter [Chloroflexi bacterium]|nr:cation:proton antiporter [Chloroflexota bacterium]